MNDLYNTLGVKKDATDQEIKKAYKEKAMETHPDKGGNTEAFDQVHKAYLTLSQPHSRKRYDETGTVDDNCFMSKEERIQKLAVERVIQLFGDTILTYVKTGGDIFTMMSQKAYENQANAEKTMMGHKKAQEMLGKYRKRVKRKKSKGVDFIKAWFDQQERELKNQIAITKEDIDIWTKTQSFIKEYEWIGAEANRPSMIIQGFGSMWGGTARSTTSAL